MSSSEAVSIPSSATAAGPSRRRRRSRSAEDDYGDDDMSIDSFSDEESIAESDSESDDDAELTAGPGAAEDDEGVGEGIGGPTKELTGTLYPSVPLALFNPRHPNRDRCVTVLVEKGNVQQWVLHHDNINRPMFLSFPLLPKDGTGPPSIEINQRAPLMKEMEKAARDTSDRQKQSISVTITVANCRIPGVPRGRGGTAPVPLVLKVARKVSRGNAARKKAKASENDLISELLAAGTPGIATLRDAHETLFAALQEAVAQSNAACTAGGLIEDEVARQVIEELEAEMKAPVTLDPSEIAAAAADAARRTFPPGHREAVCTAGMALVQRALLEGRTAHETMDIIRNVSTEALPDLMPRGVVLSSIVTKEHVHGEAMELLVAVMLHQRCRVPIVLKDYDGWRGRDASCLIHRIWISSPAQNNPFSATEDDLMELRTALEAQAVRRGLAAEESHGLLADLLRSQWKTDHGIDLVVWLRDAPPVASGPSGSGPSASTAASSEVPAEADNHFLLVQVTGRSSPVAYVPVNKHKVRMDEFRRCGKPLGCLIPMLWASNVYVHADFEANGGASKAVSSGAIIPWLLPNMVEDDDAWGLFRSARETFGKDFVAGSKQEPVEQPAKPRRPHQDRAVERGAVLRAEGVRYRVFLMATGAGKTLAACDDCMRAEEDDPQTIGAMPSLLVNPRIDLLLQNAMAWQSRERSVRGHGDARPFYYVVCSAGESLSSSYLRVIPVSRLCATLDKHRADGTLHLCRFFTTAEGGGTFRFEARRHAMKAGRAPEDPQFGVFVRDEVQKMCGVNGQLMTGALAIPAVWCPSYTATPAVEKNRAAAINKAVKARFARRAAANADAAMPGNEEEEAEMLSGEAAGRAVARLLDADPQDIFFQHDGPDVPVPPPGNDPGAAAAAAKSGLDGIQLLSESFLFKEISRDDAVCVALRKVVADNGDNTLEPADLWTRVEGALGRPLAVFELEPCADPAKFAQKYWDASWSPSRRDFPVIYRSRETLDAESLVLGVGGKRESAFCWIAADPDSPTDLFRVCVRVGPAAGAVVHDCSACEPATNLVGPVDPVARFDFYDCFTAQPPCLAPLRQAFLCRRPLIVDPSVSAPPVETLMQWMGVVDDENSPSGVRIKDPRRYFFDVDFQDVGHGRIVASAHDFASMNELLDLMDPGSTINLGVLDGEVRKPIVFSATNAIARRCMRVFKALIAKRIASVTAIAGHNDPLSSRRIKTLNSIGTDHIFQSDISLGPGIGMTYAQRQRRVWTYRGAERHVLFNCDLLSTGIDFPCCDGVFQQQPTNYNDIAIQRAGRCLRLDPMRPNKVGTFALPCADPYEPSADEEDRLRDYWPTNLDQKFDLAVICAEAMMDESLRSLGRLFSAYGFGRGVGASGGEENSNAQTILSQLLRLLVRTPSGASDMIPLTAADMTWFEKAFGACGRRLLQSWDLKLRRLVEWRLINPDSWPSQESKNIAEKQLGKWLGSQRAGKRAMDDGKAGAALIGMTAERASQLDVVCPGWRDRRTDVVPVTWDIQLGRLIEWRRNNPDRWPPPESTILVEKQLSVWLYRQRKGKKAMDKKKIGPEALQGMTAERASQLDAACPGWNDDPWEVQFGRLVKWRRINPDRWPSCGSIEKAEKQLGVWLSSQRHGKNALETGKTGAVLRGMTSERVEKLDNACEGWNSIHGETVVPVPWDTQLGRLVEWRRTNPDRWPYPTSRDVDEKRLGAWLNGQRVLSRAMDAGKTGAALKGMTGERVEELNEACPGWRNDDTDTWGDQVSFCL